MEPAAAAELVAEAAAAEAPPSAASAEPAAAPAAEGRAADAGAEEAASPATEQAGGSPGTPAEGQATAAAAAGAEPGGEAGVREEEGEEGQNSLDEAELQQYRELQESISQMQGLQISAQAKEAERRAAGLHPHLAAAQKAVEQKRQVVSARQADVAKFAGNRWYFTKHFRRLLPSKHTPKGKVERCRAALEEARQDLEEAKERQSAVQAQVEEAQARLTAWQGKAAELASSQERALKLEDRLFSLARADSTEEDMEIVDALCAVGEEGSEASGSDAGEAAEGAAATEAPPDFGRHFRGRLIRIAAYKIRQARAARAAKRKAGLLAAAGALGARGLLSPGKYAKDFPDAANKFNPMLHCPPSTFLWPYNSGFMGRVQKLQTGAITQAFYRFGPFDCDPADPQTACDAASAPNGSPRQPPLILLPGLGATMIVWGVPLLRALACSHEVIIMEYAGAGLSVDSSGKKWDYYRQAEATVLLAEALGISKPNILGWSSGGNTGLVLGALHGDKVGKICCLAAMAGGTNTIVPEMYEMLNPERSLSLGQTMALLFPPDQPDFRRAVSDYLKAVVSMPGSMTNAEVAPKTAQEQWEADNEFIHNDNRVWDLLPTVTNPVLLMNGECDALVPPENAERIAARIPGAKVHKFPTWGHAYKSPAELAEVVNDFLFAESPLTPEEEGQATA